MQVKQIMQTIVKFLLAIVALAQAQQLRGSMPAQSNPGAQPGTGYYWPRYPYTNDDIRKDSERTLQNNYVCKWDVTLDGIGQGTNQGILYLPPCTWITPHWHPTTYELNFVLQGQVDYTVFPFGTNPNTTEGGSDNAALKPKEPLKGSVPAGNLFMSPQGVAHLLVNNQCDGLAMMHSFPTSTTEDFFSMWADTQTMPKDYLQDVFGAEPPSDFSELYKLRIPDGIHTVSQQCMARCGITQDFYKNFKCPASLPLKHTVLEMPTPNTTVSINSTEHGAK
jgi:hypothetical protein